MARAALDQGIDAPSIPSIRHGKAQRGLRHGLCCGQRSEKAMIKLRAVSDARRRRAARRAPAALR